MDAEELITRCGEIEGASLGEGRFGPGPAVWVGKREVAHADADGTVDVRLTKKLIKDRKSDLEADPRIRLRASQSDWVSVSAGDADFAIALVREAVLANLPTAG
jgi:Luciferase